NTMVITRSAPRPRPFGAGAAEGIGAINDPFCCVGGGATGGALGGAVGGVALGCDCCDGVPVEVGVGCAAVPDCPRLVAWLSPLAPRLCGTPGTRPELCTGLAALAPFEPPRSGLGCPDEGCTPELARAGLASG